ncbi:hypothetical protein Tco_1228010 [Tanacetum coccineum]
MYLERECWTGLHEMAMDTFELQYIDRDTYSASAEDIEVQSYGCFLTAVNAYHLLKIVMPPDVLLHVSETTS